MSMLSTIIDTAVAAVVAEHPKLFEPKSIDRAQKLLTREIVKSLTREPRGDGEAAPAAAGPASFERVTADDERGIAYCNLRAIAGELAKPTRASNGDIYLPAEAAGPEVLPFAKLPPREQWAVITDLAQLTAWREFFDATLPNLARRPFAGVAPWPWPPSKAGKVYEPKPEGAAE
ncbi:MAG: hypothetical protein WDN48_05925 [Pseudolabrys sp.]